MSRPTFLLATVLSLGLSSSVSAEAWSNQHLAYKGGTRALQVVATESMFTEAFVDVPDFGRVRLHCHTNPASSAGTLRRDTLMLGTSDPRYGSELKVIMSVANSDDTWISTAEYGRGSYWLSLEPAFLKKALADERLAISAPARELKLDISLAGFPESYREMECEEIQ